MTFAKQKLSRLNGAHKGLSEWGRNWMSNALFEHRKRSVAMISELASNRYLNLVKTYPEIIENVPLKHIATYLGITDSSLSRIRRELFQT